jgi:hypothetical protein
LKLEKPARGPAKRAQADANGDYGVALSMNTQKTCGSEASDKHSRAMGFLPMRNIP